MTGNHRTVLCHESEEFSKSSQILSALGIEGATPSTTHLGCKSNLQAAVEMAKTDAGSRSWMRTREQVDGNAYSDISGSTTKAHAASVASAISTEDEPPLPRIALSFKQLQGLRTKYHTRQNEFERRLLLFRDLVDSKDKVYFKGLFDLQSDNRFLVGRNYPEAFRLISEASLVTATLLRDMIAGREKAKRHYQGRSGCEEANKSHQEFLDKLKAGEDLLFGPRCSGLGTCTFCQKRIAEKYLDEIEGWEVVENSNKRKRVRDRDGVSSHDRTV